MKTKNITLKNLLLVILTALLATCCILLINVSSNNATKVLASGTMSVELKTKYLRDEDFTLPEAEITFNGQTKAVEEKVIVFPSGKAFEKQSVVLSEVGLYKLIYSSTFDNAIVRATEEFVVSGNLYDVTSEKSSAVYGAYDQVHENLSKYPGLILKLALGDSFHYNKAIDLTNFNIYDDIISFYAVPDKIGECDAQTVELILTDAYDPDNRVLIQVKNSSQMGVWADPVVHVTAQAPGQPHSGMYGEKCRQNSYAGTEIVFSLAGTPAHSVKPDGSFDYYVGELGENRFNLSMNYKERQVFGRQMLVMDLDNAQFLDELWNGFTTGEAFLSIRGGRYINSVTTLIITGLTGADIQTNDYVGEVEPVITVDIGNYQKDNLPYAVVGKPYKIFDHSVETIYGTLSNDNVNVYYDYYSQNSTIVSVGSDDTFTPQREGIYTIVYYAKDFYGNITKELFDVEAKAVSEFSVDISNVVTSCKTGESAVVIGNVQPNNLSGEFYKHAVATHSSGATVEIDVETFSFRPLFEGNWTIDVTFSDYNKSLTQQINFVAEKATALYFEEEAVLPLFFIKNARYVLDEMNFTCYDSGSAVKKPASIYISEDGGDYTKLNGEYRVGASSSVAVKFLAQDGALSAEKVYNVKVIDVGAKASGSGLGNTLNFAKYFYSENGVVSEQRDGEVALTTTANGSSTLINKVLSREINMIFNIEKGFSNFSELVIRVRDSKDLSKVVDFSYVIRGTDVFYAINGEEVYQVTNNFNVSSSTNIVFKYQNEGFKTSPTTDRTLEVKNYLDGSTFKGFDNAYIEFEFKGVQGESRVLVKNINRQSFTRNNKDLGAPQISVPTNTGEKEFGEEVLIAAAHSVDILDPYVTIYLEVYMPDGETFARSVDGVLLDGYCPTDRDYVVKADQYGDYSVLFYAEDSSGRRIDYVYGFSVLDQEAPQITINSPSTKANKGSTVKVASCKVTDNVDSDLKVYVCVWAPDGSVKKVGDTFVAEFAGTYKVMYTCYDANGNAGINYYTVEVK